MIILSVDSRVDSLKFDLFEMRDETLIVSGLFERIGMEDSRYRLSYHDQMITEELMLENHTEVIKTLLEKLVDLEIISDIGDIKGVGHRVVQGTNHYTESVIISDKVLDDLEEFNEFLPLHNNGAVMGIKAFRELLPNTIMVCVFDTAFYQNMSSENYLYPVPYKWYTKYGVRKYGFHGMSHQFITNEVKNILKRDNFKLISCHVGNSGSVCAISDMKCIDTSMGFTPLAGVMTGTKSGTIDPSIIPYIMEKEGKNAGEVIDDLNFNSGLLGLSEYSCDIKDFVDNYDNLSEQAIIAEKIFVREIVNYIAQYYVLLSGLDVLVFTGNVLENDVTIRREVCENLACLGVKIDLDRNNKVGEIAKISSDDSNILVYVIPTNEELMMAKETQELINR